MSKSIKKMSQVSTQQVLKMSESGKMCQKCQRMSYYYVKNVNECHITMSKMSKCIIECYRWQKSVHKCQEMEKRM